MANPKNGHCCCESRVECGGRNNEENTARVFGADIDGCGGRSDGTGRCCREQRGTGTSADAATGGNAAGVWNGASGGAGGDAGNICGSGKACAGATERERPRASGHELARKYGFAVRATN